jgi:alpha-mannosidase
MATLQYPLPCSIDKIFVEYKLDKQSGQLTIDNTILKEPILTKESMHFSLGLPNQAKRLSYGLVPLRYPEDQLPGSNKEFICTDQNVVVHYDNFSLIIKSPDINLFEIGGIINENQINGAKVWQRNKQDIDQLYLYVFNNYWHTNYKAEQGGDPIHWKVQIEFSPLIK